jgi:hypothetical protein
VSKETEVRVEQLCADVLTAKTPAEVDRIIPELRAALEEHVRLAKNSLGAQASRIAFRDGVATQRLK